MKKIFYFIIFLLSFNIWAFKTEVSYSDFFDRIIFDQNIPVEKRLDLIDSLLGEDPSNFDLLMMKGDIALFNGYYYRGHEALSKLYGEKFDSLDIQWKCYFLNAFSISLEMVGLQERSAAIAMKLLQLEKPDSLKRFDLDAYLSFLDLNINDYVGYNKQFEKYLKVFIDTYDDLNSRGLLNNIWKRVYQIVIIKEQMRKYTWDKNYDSLLMKSDELLSLALDNNDSAVAFLGKAKVYSQMGRKDIAEGILKKMLLSEDIHYNTSYVVQDYMQLLNEQSRYQECLNIFDKQIPKVEVSTSPLHLASLLKEKAQALGKLGRFEEADSLYRRIIELQDEFYSKTGPLIMEDLANYNMAGILEAKQNAEHTIGNQKIIILVISALLALFIAFVGWLLWQRRRVKEREKKAQQVLDREAEQRGEKERKLTSMSLQMLNQHELLARMEEVLSDNRTDDAERLRTLQSLMRESESTDSTWRAFKQHFEESHHGFIDRLMKAHPNLTENDVKICAFMVLNFNTKDIATLTHRSVRTIETAKYRLHKKLELPAERSTLEYLRTEFVVVP